MTQLFIPGPVDVAPEVLSAQARPMLPYDSQEFNAILNRCEDRLKILFNTSRRVFLIPAGIVDLQEAALNNFGSGKILICTQGPESERWLEIALLLGKTADQLFFDYGKAIDIERLQSRLVSEQYGTVCFAQADLVTGVENPIQPIVEAIRSVSPETLILVDATATIAAVPLNVDEWGMDFIFGASHFGLALPPGLTLAVASPRAMETARRLKPQTWRLNFLRLERALAHTEPQTYLPQSLVFALDLQLERILIEGLDARYRRHEVLATHLQEWGGDHQIPLFAPVGYRSRVSTTFLNQSGIPIENLNTFLIQRGMLIANGFGRLKDKTFRIGAMGEIKPADLKRLLNTIDEYLQK